MNEVLRQLGADQPLPNPTRLGGQIGESQKDTRLRLSGTARRELEMKTGAPVLPFCFSEINARQSGDVWANVGCLGALHGRFSVDLGPPRAALLRRSRNVYARGLLAPLAGGP